MKIVISFIILMMLNGCNEFEVKNIFNGKSVFEVTPIPDIEAKDSYTILENTKKAFDIMKVNKSILKYYISGKDAKDMRVDVLTGEVTFEKFTNFKNKKVYNITVAVDDDVNLPKRKNIILNILESRQNNLPILINQNNALDASNLGRAFITEWNTTVDHNFSDPLTGSYDEGFFDGVSTTNKITIPTMGDGYDYFVDWGDGTSSLHVSSDITHTFFDRDFTHEVRIYGDFPRIVFSKDHKSDNAKKLLAIKQWGDIKWKSMGGAFDGCSNLEENAVDTPDLSNVKNMEYMFLGAEKFNGYVSDWDVSNVTNLLCVFGNCLAFNQDVGNWDVSNVTNMAGVFAGCKSFNQDIGRWNTSKVKNMKIMFKKAINFNQNIGTLDVSNVKIMNNMFLDCSTFNQNLSDWDTDNVKYMDKMFDNTTALTQKPLWFTEKEEKE